MSEGEDWQQQRRWVQPALQRPRLAVHGPTVVACTQRMLATWHDGETRDLHQEMMDLMLGIAGEIFWGTKTSEQSQEIGQALAIAQECIEASLSDRRWLPGWLPTSNRLRLRGALRKLDAIICDQINQSRICSKDREDLLSLLIRSCPEADGAGITDRQLRDELMNLFVAGRETTALALSWSGYLLAQHPAATTNLEAELQAVLGGRAPTAADLPQLRTTEHVVLESLRLFPPAYALKRRALTDCVIGDQVVPAGTVVLVAQWVLHRDARYFDDAEQFDPERWANGLAQQLPKYAYFPFGGGPRFCVGNALALMIAILALATITQQFRLRLAPGHAVKLLPAATLRPAHGIPVVLTAK